MGCCYAIPPFKEPIFKSEYDFIKWLKSRKDVECTFGILKGRFRQLKSGIRVHGIEARDRSVLHNMLLEVDGLAENWENGEKSDWEGEWGQHSRETVINNLPSSIRDRFLEAENDNFCNIDFS